MRWRSTGVEQGNFLSACDGWRGPPFGMPAAGAGQRRDHCGREHQTAPVDGALVEQHSGELACHQAARATCRHATRPSRPRVGMPPRHAGHLSACHQATRARQSATGLPPRQRYSSRATCRHAIRPSGPASRPPRFPAQQVIGSALSACHHATRAIRPRGPRVGLPSGHAGHVSACHQAARATCRPAITPRVGLPSGHAGHVSACHQATRATCRPAIRRRGPRVGLPSGHAGHVSACHQAARANCRHATRSGPRRLVGCGRIVTGANLGRPR